LERKLARLRREIEEVKEGYGRRRAEKKDVVGGGEVADGQDVAALSKMLDGISASQTKGAATAGSKLAKDLGTGIKANGPPQTSQGTGEPATYTVTYAPTYQQSHALAKAADFDARLAMLEKVLGLNSTVLPTSNSDGATKAILPTLDTLQRQVSVLSEATPSSLDAISRRVRTLTQEAERLEESRKAAKAAQDALSAAGGDASEDGGEHGEDSEQTSKINALYGTLSKIDTLAPLLPSLLDRLRSLRAIHADAATASESLKKVEQKQSDMAGDIRKWREGLGKVEEAMKLGETVMGGNMKVVEGWVKDLEAKMEKL
jgi:nuclear migration protein JNM1